jgi:hypothetical protein
MTEAAKRTERRLLTSGTHHGALPEVGTWLWGMKEARRGLLSTLDRIERAGFGQEFLDWRGPDGQDNAVGSVLYHIAGVEMGWLYFDVLMTTYPDAVKARLPEDGLAEDGKLRFLPGVTLDEHRERLAWTRQHFLEVVGGMSLEEWHELRAPDGEDYAATPAWIVYHLVEHEAGHLFEIRRVVRKWLEGRQA